MKNICERLKIIKVIINSKDNWLVREHIKYLKYCSKITEEVQKIIDMADSNNILELEKLIDRYLDKYDNSDLIYHYCSMETFKAILDSKSLWLSDSKFMNDKYEGRWIDKIVEEVIKELNDKYTAKQLLEYKKKYDALKNKNGYMCCFSKASDKLSQWRGYADDASGVAIGFSREAIRLTSNFNFELALMDVLYDKEEHMRLVKESIEHTIVDKYDIKQDKELAYFYKNPSFYEEEEVRILYIPENDMKELIFADPLEAEYYSLMSNNISKIKYRKPKSRDNFFKKIIFNICKFICRIEKNDEKNIPYFEYDLTGTMKGFSSDLIPEVIVGPKNRTDLEEIKELLRAQGLNNTKTIPSKSSYI